MKLAMRAWAWAAAVAVLIAATSSSASSEPASEPTVLLEKGRVRGVAMTSEGGRMYTAFKGLPYARPPVGKYRFREPKAAKPWQGVWDGARLPPKCLQFERFPVSDVLGDEDCLYLSVFTPRLPETGAPLMDVLVWIHGGGFMYGGSSEYGAEFIMDHDIVLVNINYRLGPLGFLSTEDDVVPGNNGLKDQAMALRWVQANIAAFGGNPNSVTLLGLSAGGASVHYQYLSPLTKGLFHRGWSMSGSALCPWTLQEAARAKAHRLAELTGCPSGANVTSRDLVECLRHRPARALVSAVPRMQDALHLPFSVFAPVVEPAGTPGAFLELPPAQVVRDGLAHDLPWITGITSEEGLYNAAEFLGPANADRLQALEGSGWLEKAPLLLDYAYTVSDATQRDALSAAVRKLYLGQRSLAEAPKEFIAMIGDRIFNAGVEWAAREMAAVNTQPVFLYEFAFRGLASLSTYMSGGDATDWGVSHGDDAAYIFKWIAVDVGKTANERKVSKQLLSILSSFARTGVPSALPGSPAWPPLEPKATDLRILRVNKNAELSVDNVPEFGQSSFWASQPLAEQQPLNTLSSSRDEL